MYDMIVVGGGPGGSSAAGMAASLGLKVLLLEKEVFPRSKPCGGAVSEQALSYLGGSIPRALMEKEIFGARIKYGGNTLESRSEQRLAVMVDRGDFDHYFLERARSLGAEIRFQGVRDMTEEAGGVRALTREGETFWGKYGVVAEGAHGNLKNRVGRKGHKGPEGFCLTARIKGEKARQLEDVLEVHFGVAPMGYGWIFPHREYCSVGVGGLSSRMKDAKIIFSGFLHRNGLPHQGPVQGHRIPCYWHARPLAGERILLCGDAGGFVDTFLGEGIAYAVRSGQLAAKSVASRLKEGGPPAELAYTRACRAEFSGNLKYSYILARLSAAAPGLFFPLLTGKDRFLKKFLEIPLQQTTYKKILLSLPMHFLRDLPLLLVGKKEP